MKTLFALFLIALLAACAPGRDFVRPQNTSLTLGSTTRHEIVDRYGEPRDTEDLTVNGVPMQGVLYSYSDFVPFTRKMEYRSLQMYFKDNVLVSYNYVSSFDQDKKATRLDDEKLKKIKKGDNKSKVLSVLGEPTGVAIAPVASSKGGLDWTYSQLETTRVPFIPTGTLKIKLVTISFDSNDAVTEIASVERTF